MANRKDIDFLTREIEMLENKTKDKDRDSIVNDSDNKVFNPFEGNDSIAKMMEEVKQKNIHDTQELENLHGRKKEVVSKQPIKQSGTNKGPETFSNTFEVEKPSMDLIYTNDLEDPTLDEIKPMNF